jgi:hypothetical protein
MTMNKTKANPVNVKLASESGSPGKTTGSDQEQDRSTTHFHPYRLVSINKEQREASPAKATWYRYVVGNGKSTITGHRPGPRDQVEEHAERFTAELNERGARGYNSIWSPRRGRPAQKPKQTDNN